MRLGSIFVVVCMVLIAASFGAVLYLVVGLSGSEATTVALSALAALAIYSAVTARLQDRSNLGAQIADLSRGTADLARQVGEISRRVAAVESRVDSSVNRARGATDPIAAEIGELGGLVRQIAETVASHAAAL